MLAHDLAMALDPVLFARDALGFNPDPSQMQVLRWTGKRLLLNCSRQWGKSTTTSILAVHEAVFRPDSLILLVSPSLRQSSELYRKVSEFMERLPLKPARLEDNRLALQLENGSRIVTLPSKEATVRGFSGATLIIEDEASRVDDLLYKTMRPMLAVSGGRLVLMSTPHGRRGHFWEEWDAGGATWERISVKATDCPRIPKSFLDEERASQGDWWYRQEYMCEFLDAANQVFSHQLVMNAISSDVKPLF
jgi:hypothetical protein